LVKINGGSGLSGRWAVSDEPFVDVVDVQVLTRYVLKLTFSNGEVGVVDVEDLLFGPAFEPLRSDYATFMSVRVDPELGTVVWPNGADLSPEMLYARARGGSPSSS
jgi:Protein of unknown function (DUF2442)